MTTPADAGVSTGRTARTAAASTVMTPASRDVDVALLEVRLGQLSQRASKLAATAAAAEKRPHLENAILKFQEIGAAVEESAGVDLDKQITSSPSPSEQASPSAEGGRGTSAAAWIRAQASCAPILEEMASREACARYQHAYSKQLENLRSLRTVCEETPREPEREQPIREGRGGGRAAGGGAAPAPAAVENNFNRAAEALLLFEALHPTGSASAPKFVRNMVMDLVTSEAKRLQPWFENLLDVCSSVSDEENAGVESRGSTTTSLRVTVRAGKNEVSKFWASTQVFGRDYAEFVEQPKIDFLVERVKHTLDRVAGCVRRGVDLLDQADHVMNSPLSSTHTLSSTRVEDNVWVLERTADEPFGSQLCRVFRSLLTFLADWLGIDRRIGGDRIWYRAARTLLDAHSADLTASLQPSARRRGPRPESLSDASAAALKDLESALAARGFHGLSPVSDHFGKVSRMRVRQKSSALLALGKAMLTTGDGDLHSPSAAFGGRGGAGAFFSTKSSSPKKSATPPLNIQKLHDEVFAPLEAGGGTAKLVELFLLLRGDDPLRFFAEAHSFAKCIGVGGRSSSSDEGGAGGAGVFTIKSSVTAGAASATTAKIRFHAALRLTKAADSRLRDFVDRFCLEHVAGRVALFERCEKIDEASTLIAEAVHAIKHFEMHLREQVAEIEKKSTRGYGGLGGTGSSWDLASKLDPEKIKLACLDRLI